MSTPHVAPSERVTVVRESEHFWRAEARFGFIERHSLGAVLKDCKLKGADIDLDDVTYYVGHETIVPRDDGKGLPRWVVSVFAAMGRNASRISDSLELPHDRVVEIGREIAI
jgi:KUP system potassium uptake protein